jgi:glycosyltransferase involved in cell wall biosynthesis
VSTSSRPAPPATEADGDTSARPHEDEAPGVLFSFLVPAYRTEELIGETLDSVLAQTRDDWECVVVDNGNSDAMAAVVEPYTADPRVRLVRQENRGYAGGVNAAAAVARGRYFVPLCSDDLVSPDYCERMGAAIDALPGVDVISPDARVFYEDGRVKARTFTQFAGVPRRRIPQRDLRLTDLMEQQFLYYGAAFHRDAWHGVGGHRTDTPRVDDLDLWLRLVSAGWSVRAIPDVLGWWRVRDDSLSHAPENVDAFEAEAQRVFTRAAHESGRPEDLAALDVALRRIEYGGAIRRARWAFLRGDVDTARAEARAAWAQRRTVRVAAILAGLTVAPGVLRRVRPLKQRATEVASRTMVRLRALTRR